MKKNILVSGACGKMGNEICLLLEKHKSLNLVEKVGSNCDLTKIEQVTNKKIDAVVDFSHAEMFDEILDWCLQNETPIVSGTTGLTLSSFKKIDEASKKIPVLWAANMSVGVQLFAQLLQYFSALDDFDFQIEEIHHKHKKDSPSGTALFLQEKLKSAVGEIPAPLSVRGGGVFGVHRLLAMSDDEVIKIEHQAMNRSVFAKGALKALEFILNKTQGRFDMKDVLFSSR